MTFGKQFFKGLILICFKCIPKFERIMNICIYNLIFCLFSHFHFRSKCRILSFRKNQNTTRNGAARRFEKNVFQRVHFRIFLNWSHHYEVNNTHIRLDIFNLSIFWKVELMWKVKKGRKQKHVQWRSKSFSFHKVNSHFFKIIVSL